MKYSVSIDLDLPRDRVIEIFDSTENLYKWQEGLQSLEHQGGEPGQEGATSKLVFQMGKRTIEMIETITLRNLPDDFSATYDAKGVKNLVANRFIAVGPEQTRWKSDNVFEFQGFMKVIGFLFKGSFPKQSLKYMEHFKAFAENGVNVNETN